jgi:hypothetical protein
MALLKDLASAGVRKVALSDMVNCARNCFSRLKVSNQGAKMIELFDAVGCRFKNDVLNE